MNKLAGSPAPDSMLRQRLVQARVRLRLDAFVSIAYRDLFGQSLIPEWYLEPLCFALQRAAEAEASRLLVTIPPRHLKSFSASVCLPAQKIGLDPQLKFLVVVYGRELAREHHRLLTDIMTSRWYQATFPECHISEVREETVRTSAGGSVRFVSVGGPITGFGIHVLVVDDVLKAQDAGSAAMREAGERFIFKTCTTRFDDPAQAKIIAISQRLHVYDLASRMIEQGIYRHLNLPSVGDQNRELTGYGGKRFHFRAGDLLSPVRFPHAVLASLRAEMGEAAFAAQFLQAPLPTGGSIVDLARLSLVDRAFSREDLQYVVMSIDPAVKAHEDCDFTAISIFGYSGNAWRLMHVVERRMDYVELHDTVRAHVLEWKPDKILIEDCHTGVALWSELKKAKILSICVKPEGGKEERLSVACGRFYSGEIGFPRDEPWSDRVFAQFRAFPDGHDDILDSITQFAGWLRRTDIEQRVHTKQYGRPSNPTRRGGGR